MSIHAGETSNYQPIYQIGVGVGGSYQNVKEAYVGDGGTWRSALFIFDATVSADTNNYDVSAAATSAGWNGSSAVAATITVNNGVIVGSTSTATPAFTTGTLPAGSRVALTNNGKIYGRGGNGGGSGTPPNAGSAGGLALEILCTMALVNSVTGVIAGGGGGGGGGQNGFGIGGGGGGGQGRQGGTGGGGFTAGENGDQDNFGLGGDPDGEVDAVGGADGGPLGTAGNGGGGTRGAGGAAGAATSGISNATVTNNGSIIGAQG